MSEESQPDLIEIPRGTTPLFYRPDPRDSLVSSFEREIALCEVRLRRMGMNMKAVALKRRLTCIKEFLRAYMVEADSPVRGVNRKSPKRK